MSDERRKAAEEWCVQYGESWLMKGYLRFSRANVEVAIVDAHMAGQSLGYEAGRKDARREEREAIASWLTSYNKVLGAVPGLVFSTLASQIRNGAHHRYLHGSDPH
mgnify:CR=1 FL=1